MSSAFLPLALKDFWFSLSLERGAIGAHLASEEDDPLFLLWL